ncbi:hypothetical protein [uncultured Massilia sp.]|uniref:hypothetical protein n=1 Tax=uncultured Massilia sp. TaxID=169973 RepID=UPI0025E497F8|nr:hypothetical protein [uncultured Massilia sp.]
MPAPRPVAADDDRRIERAAVARLEAIFAATGAFMLRAMGDVRLSAIAGEVDGAGRADA